MNYTKGNICSRKSFALFHYANPTTRVADPGGGDPDPDPTFKINPGIIELLPMVADPGGVDPKPDPNLEKHTDPDPKPCLKVRQIRHSLSFVQQ